MKASRHYSISVERTVRQVLDLLTRKRKFALVTAGEELSCEKTRKLQNAGYLLCEIGDSGDKNTPDATERHYLAIGGSMASRDCALASAQLSSEERGEGDKEVSLEGFGIEFLPIGNLYELCNGKALQISISADTEDEANRVWLRDMLRLGEDPGKWYASDDYSSIRIRLQRISASYGSKAIGMSPEKVALTSADIAEFEVYDRLRGKFERMARDRGGGYGDDIFVEYSISSDEGDARYCAIEFYTNHNWNSDPANLLVVRFCAEILPGECGQEDVRFSHPTKATERKADGERFLVDSLVMANDVKVKFMSGRGENKRPNEAVSADRVMENLVDFNMWLDMHREEIELL